MPYIRANCGEVTATWRDAFTRTPSPAGGQPLEAAQDKGRPPFRIFGIVEPQIRQSAQQGRDRDLRLDACQLGAEAEVYAPAEGQRTDVGTGNIEAIRPVRIDRRVAVGRAQQAEHRLTFR